MRGLLKLNYEFSSQDTDQKDSEEESNECATDDFADTMTNSLFETRKAVLIEVKLINKHVEVAALIA